MAVAHILYDKNSHYGAMFRTAIISLEKGYEDLNDLLATLATMLDGDGTQAAHFDYITARFGFESNVLAKAAWDELNSVMFKLNTDASVSSVNAALRQFFNKFR
jgi:hypothetical protein